MGLDGLSPHHFLTASLLRLAGCVVLGVRQVFCGCVREGVVKSGEGCGRAHRDRPAVGFATGFHH